ncbi:hypothetical protein IGI04_031590 [Brassica rapa subsp. trilocularis]|uniref:Uncharacterized protein n=1 Tax=Brassica rapa subsp. trilocularis TaxID=1813537 RepID=A0ABQ7LTZ8_BRACM|nr:hypothetical protein IGI04_031590 [Brassica rapa subsp. trilocularis]
MAENVKERGDGSAELVKSMGDKHASVIRPAARYYSAIKDAMVCGKGRYTLVKDVDDVENGAYDKPLPCFGCGIGWFSFLLGFLRYYQFKCTCWVAVVQRRDKKMNKRFGGKKPTGTPSLALSTVVVVASLLAGASVVHNLYKPDLTLPQMGSDEVDKKEESRNKD